MRKILLWLLIALAILAVSLVVLFNIPSLQDRIVYRLDELGAQVKDIIAPPEKVVFIPQNKVAAVVMQTIAVWTLTPATAQPTPTPQPARGTTPTLLPSPTPLPTITPTPIPSKVVLNGIVHEYQKWNNCGPANLAMALSYWKWQGDQMVTAAYLKPNTRDKNVMPYEMANFVADKTTFKSVVRVGGDVAMLKAFIAAGFPVIVEKGFEGVSFDGWMGHYEVINGYDDSTSRFSVQDSYVQPTNGITYTDLVSNWRAFNYTYIVVYPPDRESEVMAILGPQADEQANYRYAEQLAQTETQTLQGRDLFFAWFNLGSSLVDLQDYGGAAKAYDEAYKIYPTIPEKKRPYRIVWYETGPYFAYFNTGRLQDVIDLATQTINSTTEPAIEESWVWRARAEVMLGDAASAISDYQTALKWHPGFQPAIDGLKALGVTP